MSHLFTHIMVGTEQDTPNWILDESDGITLKSVRAFFLDPGLSYGWGEFI